MAGPMRKAKKLAGGMELVQFIIYLDIIFLCNEHHGLTFMWNVGYL